MSPRPSTGASESPDGVALIVSERLRGSSATPSTRCQARVYTVERWRASSPEVARCDLAAEVARKIESEKLSVRAPS